MALTERPDILLMDLEMPVVDRWEPMRSLKNDPQTRHIPIIGLSAYALDSEREKAIASGWAIFDAPLSALPLTGMGMVIGRSKPPSPNTNTL